jgi:peptidoglycan hydrolase CwlO-like protein
MSDGGHAASWATRRAVPAALLALLLTLAVPGVAAAEPVPTSAVLVAQAKALQARLDRQHAAIERLTERLNATEERRRGLRRNLADLRARQRLARRQLDQAQARLDEQARATYMNGPQWLLSELVGGAPNPQDAMRRLPLQKAALEAQAGVVTEVRRRKAELDGLNRRVASDLAEAERVHRAYVAERGQLQALVERLQATLDGIDRKLAGYLEAERARAEAARRAAYAGYMAGVGSLQSWLRAGPAARAAVRFALDQLGDPYQWGAIGPHRFDCSGLTSSAYRAAGVAIPRVSVAQWGAGPHVDVAYLLPGDLVFYADVPSLPSTIHHVGMYIGNGLMVHAPHTGDVVRVASIWREGYAGAVRVVPGVPGQGTPPPPPVAPPPPTTSPPPPPTMTTAPTTTRPPPAESTTTSTSGTTSSTTTTSTVPPTTS